MSGQITRRLKPEEQELLRKREELAWLRANLADRELELADFRRQLAVFEGRYLRQVGGLYAELDEWKARLSELKASINPSPISNSSAHEAREQARRTYEEAHGKASEAPEFMPTAELKSLFRDVAKRVHPDLSKDAADQERRTRFMADANEAYQAGDAEALRRILDEYEDGAESVEGEGIGAELIRIIRQISLVTSRVAAIEQELANLRQSEIGLLMTQAADRAQAGGDLLAELSSSVQEQIDQIRNDYASLAKQAGKPV
jgi:chromosome segregation ATPase